MKLSLFGKKELSKQFPSHTEEANKTCGICFDLKIDSEIFQIRSKIFKRRNCNHLFCIDCICKYVDIKLNDNEYKVMCPRPNCCVTFKPKYLQHILPKQRISRWEYLISESSFPMEQKNYCPYQDCSVLLKKGKAMGGKVVTNSECPSCHRNFCAQCKVPWHEGMDCPKFQQWECGDKYDLDIKFLELAKRKKWKRCPNCAMFVNKNLGCNDMLCRCGCHFCYRCGKKCQFYYLHKCNSSWF